MQKGAVTLPDSHHMKVQIRKHSHQAEKVHHSEGLFLSRTNKVVEGWHNSFNCHIDSHHVGIWKLIGDSLIGDLG